MFVWMASPSQPGLWSGPSNGRWRSYTSAHLARADALPLSLSLPLTDEPYGDIVTRAFFDNLLQERDGAPLNDVMAREGWRATTLQACCCIWARIAPVHCRCCRSAHQR